MSSFLGWLCGMFVAVAALILIPGTQPALACVLLGAGLGGLGTLVGVAADRR